MFVKRLAGFVTALGLVGLVGSASAANFANVTLSVEVTGSLSMKIVGSDQTTLAPVIPGGSSVSGTGIVLENDSIGMLETFSLKGFDSGTWLLNQTSGDNQYALQALFNSTAPSAADFSVPGDSIGKAADRKATPTVFSGDQSGAGVLPGSQRKLWFKFDAPSVTNSFGARQLSVSIVANLAD